MTDKKEQIIDIATKLFSEKGFENTALSEVCEKANVSKGLIFHHFKSKNDLLREIYSKTTRQIVEMNVSSSSTARERLLQLLESFFKQLKADKIFFQLNLNMMLQPSTRDVLQDLIKERSSFILKSTNNLFKEIAPDNAQIMSYTFIAELDGIAISYLCVFDKYPLMKMKEYIINKYSQL